MKSKILLITSMFLSYLFHAQEESLNIDLLKSPSSPASNLLGIATSDVNKPTDVSNLMLNLQDFTSIFKNNSGYAVDFAPYWLFGKQTKTLDNIVKDSLVSDVIKQTFVLSIAVKNTDSTNTSLPINSVYTSYGFKFSLFRGKVSDEISDKYKEIKNIHRKIINSSQQTLNVVDKDSEVIRMKEQLLTLRNQLVSKGVNPEENEEFIKNRDNYDKIRSNLKTEFDTNKKDDKDNFANNSELIKQKLKDFSIVRTGFLWDFAGGTSIQFRDKQFNNSRLYNAGLWTVLGYAFEKSGTPLFLIRYMYNPKADWMTVADFKPEGNFSTFDAGLKYEYNPKDSKFTGSLEGLYRSFISGSDLKPTWKCVLNLDYAIFPNQHLTLSLGKDFDNNIIKNGNVIAGLSFLSGIGTKRKIQ